MTLTLYNNDEKIEVNYTVENNINPTDDYLKNMLKRIYFSKSIYFGGGAAENNHLLTTYTQNNYQLLPSMFTNGHIKLFDENNNIIGIADLSTSYSGTDTYRGSVNINECTDDVTNNAYSYKLVVDFPTSAGNGTIKNIKFYPYPYYNKKFTDIETYLKPYYYNNMYTRIRVSNVVDNNIIFYFKTIYLENGDLIFVNGYNKTLKYKNKVYDLIDIYLNYVYLMNGKLYTIENNLSDSKTLNIVELIVDDDTLTVVKSDNKITIDLSTINNISNGIDPSIISYNNYIYLYLFDSTSGSNRDIIIKLDQEGNIIKHFTIENRNWINGTFAMNQFYNNKKNIVAWRLDENNCRCFISDYENDIFEYKAKTISSLYGEEESFAYNCYTDNNISNNSLRIKWKDKMYSVIRFNESSYFTDIYETKNPLIYTFNEPIVKTSNQTMKLVFNITIS